MQKLTGVIGSADCIIWQHMGEDPVDAEPGISISFFFHFQIIQERQVLNLIESTLRNNDEAWIERKREFWSLDLDAMKRRFNINTLEGIKGRLFLKPDVEHRYEDVFEEPRRSTFVRFRVSEEEVSMQAPKRIFLSHKGVDKEMVREYSATLKLLGFDPWLDEDAMPAGTDINRGILAGFKVSCAAVFFVSPSFVDEGFLATEVGYAIDQNREKRDRFVIITLQLTGPDGSRGTVPELLRSFVWKTPASPLQGLQEIVRALPIQVGPVNWH